MEHEDLGFQSWLGTLPSVHWGQDAGFPSLNVPICEMRSVTIPTPPHRILRKIDQVGTALTTAVMNPRSIRSEVGVSRKEQAPTLPDSQWAPLKPIDGPLLKSLVCHGRVGRVWVWVWVGML